MAKLSNGNIIVRVLVDVTIGTKQYRPNDVVELPPKIANRLIKSGGQVDPDDDAVQYALSNGAKVIVHKDDEPEAPADDSGGQEQ